MKSLLPGRIAALLLTSSGTKNSETKSQLGDANQGAAVLARDGQTVNQMAESVAASAANACDMTIDKLANMKLKEVTTPGIAVRSDGATSVYGTDKAVQVDTDMADFELSATPTPRQVTASIS